MDGGRRKEMESEKGEIMRSSVWRKDIKNRREE
jgi:hypothetical protein